jgi:hypothetical protein
MNDTATIVGVSDQKILMEEIPDNFRASERSAKLV